MNKVCGKCKWRRGRYIGLRRIWRGCTKRKGLCCGKDAPACELFKAALRSK